MSKSNFSRTGGVAEGVRFSRAMFGTHESSRMTASPIKLTTFDAGCLVPIYCREILPDEIVDLNFDSVIRQTTILTPTMGTMECDVYAFFVPNRVINSSWKTVQGENVNGSWVAPEVTLAPLHVSNADVQIPVCSVADYYGFPTQAPLRSSVLNLCNDLKFRGYVSIWNEFFRDQNYQPPLPFSPLNIYQGFLDPEGSVSLDGSGSYVRIDSSTDPDNNFAKGALVQAIYGNSAPSGAIDLNSALGNGRFKAYNPPLRVNKIHDYYTSVLPSPQKGPSVLIPSSGRLANVLPVITGNDNPSLPAFPMRLRSTADFETGTHYNLGITGEGSVGDGTTRNVYLSSSGSEGAGGSTLFYPLNLQVASGAAIEGMSVSVSDLRMSAAVQQLYEIMARGGTRYRELMQTLFGIDYDDPYKDIPSCLGHVRFELDLYQTAQTSSSSEGNTPQANLAAFGYTQKGGNLVRSHKFLEHGYLHVFAVVRHRNVYSTELARDNFRLSMLDFYTPPLANISEQPVYTRQINPFNSAPNAATDGVFGYQEAWAEYRYEQDTVTGLMRPGVTGSLSVWNYADPVDTSLLIADASWLLSNSKNVLDRTLAVTSDVSGQGSQFKAAFRFYSDKTLPMPVDSVPGMDII